MNRKKFSRYEKKFLNRIFKQQTILTNIGVKNIKNDYPLRVVFGIRNLKGETNKSWISLQIDASHVFEWL